MHRPTRKLKHLLAKTKLKVERSRLRGKKAKRWAKWIDAYKPLSQDEAGDAGS